MGRNKTNTVEYFPHIAKPGKTLFILEGKYGNDGYAFWFKLLEILADTEDHFYDASDETSWQYLVARTRLTDISATEILNLLANLGNINKQLWKNRKFIWCQALVDNLNEVYRKRKRDLPRKPLCDSKDDNCDRNEITVTDSTPADPITATESTQSKVEESKVEKKVLIASPENGDASPFFSCQFFEVPKTYRKKLSTEYPAMTDAHLLREFSKMEDWISDNRKKKKFKANGHLANPKMFIKNWLEKIVIQPQVSQPDEMDAYMNRLVERDGVKLCGKA